MTADQELRSHCQRLCECVTCITQFEIAKIGSVHVHERDSAKYNCKGLGPHGVVIWKSMPIAQYDKIRELRTEHGLRSHMHTSWSIHQGSCVLRSLNHHYQGASQRHQRMHAFRAEKKMLARLSITINEHMCTSAIATFCQAQCRHPMQASKLARFSVSVSRC